MLLLDFNVFSALKREHRNTVVSCLHQLHQRQ